MTVVIEDLDGILTLDEEICEHVCPLHDDLSIGELADLTDYERAWLELACRDVAFHEDGARHWQLVGERRDLDGRDLAFARGQVRAALRGARRIATEMHRTLRGLPEPPLVDLWKR